MGSLCLGRYGSFRRKFETGTGWRRQSTSHFRRNRRAFDVARRCHGARMATQSGVRLESTDAERVVAAPLTITAAPMLFWRALRLRWFGLFFDRRVSAQVATMP